jgi:uncharacterized protein YkwD
MNETSTGSPTRRQVTKGAAWAAPVLLASTAAPVLAASPAVSITTTTLPVGYVGEAYSAPLAATGGSGTYTWAAWTAPGTTLGHTTGIISGVPTAAGPHPVDVTVMSGSVNSSADLTMHVGVDRTAAAAEMLRLINARRASIGAPLMSIDPALNPGITSWVEGLAADGSGLVHQNPLPPGVYAENLSATCSTAPVVSTPVDVGASLTNGWLDEPHSYTEYKALLDAGQTAQAQAMYHGTGAYAGVGASGHRINLENPSYSRIGIGLAYGVNGSACGSSYPYGYWGGTAQA